MEKYKIFIAKAYGCSAIGEGKKTLVLSKPFLSYPNEVCTETFLEIGPFDSITEAENVISYIKSKVFRFLVGIRKKTQNTSKSVYRYVPLQDFTDNSNINWNQAKKSITNLDKQLYQLYNLSNKDIAYIESEIEPMDE